MKSLVSASETSSCNILKVTVEDVGKGHTSFPQTITASPMEKAVIAIEDHRLSDGELAYKSRRSFREFCTL